jgi:hypothetical protein
MTITRERDILMGENLKVVSDKFKFGMLHGKWMAYIQSLLEYKVRSIFHLLPVCPYNLEKIHFTEQVHVPHSTKQSGYGQTLADRRSPGPSFQL